MIICIVTISILILFIFSSYIAYRFITPKRSVEEWTPEDFGYKYEDFSIETSDGVEIKGWYISGGKECVILLHGYGRSRWDNVYMKRLIAKLPARGYSLVTFDFRAHGESGGKHTTLGYLEMIDLKSVYEWTKRRHQKIYIIGFSMGGNIALRAASAGMGDKVIADSPFVNINATAKRAMNYFAGLPSFIYYLVKPFATTFLRINYEELNLMNFAKGMNLPILIIAGKNDRLVTISEIREFFNLVKTSNSHAFLWMTNGEHVRSILLDEKLYIQKILEFLKDDTSQTGK